MKPEMKKLIIANLPYLLFVYLFGKLGQAYRLAEGIDLSQKLLHFADGCAAAFESAAPSFHPIDLLIGVAGAAALRLMVYCKGKNAKKYRKGVEYGSARWGGPKDIAPYGPVSLSENEFTTQWQTIATEEERNSFLAEHTSVMTDAGELTLSEQSYYEEAIGETAYNSYTDVLYIFPDSVCEKLLPVMRNRYITTSENISYENARELEQVFSDEYPEITDTGVRYTIRLSTLQINSTKANNFVMQASMLYGAVVLMVICLTILSLQQLLDAGKYKYRFSVLRKLGVEEQQIGKLVLRSRHTFISWPNIFRCLLLIMMCCSYMLFLS